MKTKIKKGEDSVPVEIPSKDDLNFLVSGINPDNIHTEKDWGETVGNELW